MGLSVLCLFCRGEALPVQPVRCLLHPERQPATPHQTALRREALQVPPVQLRLPSPRRPDWPPAHTLWWVSLHPPCPALWVRLSLGGWVTYQWGSVNHWPAEPFTWLWQTLYYFLSCLFIVLLFFTYCLHRWNWFMFALALRLEHLSLQMPWADIEAKCPWL